MPTGQEYLRLGAMCALLAPLWLHAQWESLLGGVNGSVKTLLLNPDSSALVLGGTFPFVYADSLRVNNLAAWTGDTWTMEGLGDGNGDTSAVGSWWNQFVSLAYHHDTLFCGISGTSFQYHPEWRFGAAMHNNLWFPIGNPEGWLFVMKVNDRLFSGGQVDTLYGQYMPGIKEWVGGAWQAIPNMPLGPGTYYCATYWHDQYWFAGSFISGGARSVIAFDGVDQWIPNWGPGGGWINAIAGFGDSLYVGGWYPPGSDTESPMIQLWDGAEWQPFFPEVLQFHWQIQDIEVYEGALYVSGDFHFIDDPETQYSLLRFDGHELCAIGGVNTVGVNGQIAFFQGDLYMALASQFLGLEFEWIGRLPLEGLVPDRCVEVVTMVNDQDNIEQLIISPNPTEEFITFHSGASGVPSNVIIRDALGRSIPAAFSTQDGSMRVDIQNLPRGCYCLEVRSVVGKHIGKFIKR